MHQTLYRKWRPSVFSEVVGQEHITSILQYEVANGKTTHAYLFCGSRGTGKTTCAKILAKAVNCLMPENGNPCGKCEACRAIESGTATDVLEMDAASNNGVNNIRDIRDEVVYAPAMLKNRVYIIDEVHMLSQSAFNALLKTLEEPPPQVIFILATTELQKIPATILSRCQRFDFRRILTAQIVRRLEYIAKEENIKISGDAAGLIARLAQGGMRDAISLLELCAGSGGDITVDTVRKSAGIAGRDAVCQMAKAVLGRDCEAVFAGIEELYASSVDITVFWQDLIAFYRDMLVIKCTAKPSEYLDMTADEFENTKALSEVFSREKLLYHSRLLDEAFLTMQRGSAAKRLTAEMTLVRMCDEKLDDSNEALLARLAVLEDIIASGGAAVKVKPASDRPVSRNNTSFEAENAAVVAQLPVNQEEKKENTQPKQESIPQDDTRKDNILRAIGGWLDIVKKVERSDSGTAAMLRIAKAYSSDGGKKVVIHVGSSFSEMLLSRNETKKLIAGALNASGGFGDMTEADITVKYVKPEAAENDYLNEIVTQ